jgi:tyrosyl-tRNA synthetase
MLEREDFRSRLDANQPIAMHELLYPLLTAIDAVKLHADVELGGTEQKFNLLVHREIQREYGTAAEAVLTMPILVGTDGTRKMSKSLGNYIGVSEAPGDMFGKVMSISDQLMWSYYELVTDFDSRTIERLKQEVKDGALHPMEAKMQLAHSIVADFHGEAAAQRARDEFQRVFRQRQSPEEVPVQKIAAGAAKRLSLLLVDLDMAASRSEAERLIKQGGVEINGERTEDVKKEIALSPGGEFLLRAGKKKFVRLIVG